VLKSLETRAVSRFFAEAGRSADSPLPDETLPPGTDRLPALAHIVVLMMENHSYDNYLGMLDRGDGLPRDAQGAPVAANPGADGDLVRAHHRTTTGQIFGLPSQTWEASHIQWNGGANDGFVRSVEAVARLLHAPVDPATRGIAMAYWTGEDLPFYYGLARTFPIADRWFASCLGPTIPNRRFLVAGTAHGLATDQVGKTFDVPAHGTIFDTLSRYGISWTNYHAASPLRVVLTRLFGLPGLRGHARSVAPASRGKAGAFTHELESKLQFTADAFPVTFVRHMNHIRGIRRFFRDAAAGTLPAVSIVDPSFVDFSEENPQDVQRGERFAATVIKAVIGGPAWPSTLLVWLYDEHGGYYDHVPPPPAVEPDDARPDVDDPAARYDRYGFRVPAVIVSPYARPGFVLHDVHDHTSLLRLIENKWNLAPLTARDASANNLLDALDLSAPPPFLEPPVLPPPALGFAEPPAYEF
jgi:phospholipase C